MKGKLFYVVISFTIVWSLLSCKKEEVGKGFLSISFAKASYEQTRADAQVPDTVEFLLKIVGPKDKVIYNGKYGVAPKNIELEEGSYSISVRSVAFKRPSFNMPLYGDDVVVVVRPNDKVHINLQCVLINSGIKLKIGGNFLKLYPSALVYIQSEDGKLLYSHAEKRVAYFSPGKVVVYMEVGGKKEVLFNRVLAAREVLYIDVIAPSVVAEDKEDKMSLLALNLDTTKYWIKEEFIVGGKQGKGSADMIVSVGQARSMIGKKDVWVAGYIVGCINVARLQTDGPFTVASNIVLGSNKAVDDKNRCIVVELRKKSVKDKLNLVSNSNILGKYVKVKGTIVDSYYGTLGLKSVIDCKFK